MKKIKTPTNELWKVNRPTFDKWIQETMVYNMGYFIETIFDLQGKTSGILSESNGAIALAFNNVSYSADDGHLVLDVNAGTGFKIDNDVLRLIRWPRASVAQADIVNYSSNGTIFDVEVYLTYSWQDSNEDGYLIPTVPLEAGVNVSVRQDMIPSITLKQPADSAVDGILIGKLNFTTNTVTGLPSYNSADESDKDYVIFRPTRDRFDNFNSRLSSLNSRIGDVSVIGGQALVQHLNGLNESQNGNANQLAVLASVMMGESQFTAALLDEGLLTLRELNDSVTTMSTDVEALQQTMFNHYAILGANNYDTDKGTIHERLTRLENYPDGVFHIQNEVDLRTFDFNFSNETDHYEAAYGVSPATASDVTANRIDPPALTSYINNHPGFLFQGVDEAYEKRMNRAWVDTNGDLNVELATHYADELDWRFGLHEDDRIILKHNLSYNTVNGQVTYSGKVVGYSFRGYIKGSNAYLTLETGSGATKTLINSSPLAAGYHAGTAVSFFGAQGKDFTTDIVIRGGRFVSDAWQDTDFNMIGNLVIYYYINDSSGTVIE